MKHAFLQLLVRLVERSLSNDKDQVDMLDNLVLMVPDNLFNQPSHPVADNRIADLFAARNADAKLLYLFFARPIDNKLMIGEGLSVSIYPAEISAVP
jgi:hypothetical protein